MSPSGRSLRPFLLQLNVQLSWVTSAPERDRRKVGDMRDLETIDSELRLLAAVRRVCREYDGRVPSMTLVDDLLDERRANRGPRIWPSGAPTNRERLASAILPV
jgi:hypothetical protein